MTATPRTYRYARDKASLLARLRKIEGQAKGVQEMIATDRYCIDIVQQLSALSAAAEEVAILILEGHIEGCVADAIREEHGDEHIHELMRTIRRAIRR
jgi:DNA-binding FrmR family transcriptional regulator